MLKDLSKYKADGAIRMETRNASEQNAFIEGVRRKWRAFELDHPGVSPLRPPMPAEGVRSRVISTDETLTLLAEHASRGCMLDQFEIGGMYLKVGRVYQHSDLIKWMALRGDSLVEDVNGHLKPLVDNASLVDFHVMHFRVFFRLAAHSRAAKLRYERCRDVVGVPNWQTPADLAQGSHSHAFAAFRMAFLMIPAGGVGPNHPQYEPMGWRYKPAVQAARAKLDEL